MFNPPENRESIKDTLFCLGAPYVYAKVASPKGHTWVFVLPETNSRIQIWSAYNITLDGKRVKDLYNLKLALMNLYRHKI